jgi:hypothetical protein
MRRVIAVVVLCLGTLATGLLPPTPIGGSPAGGALAKVHGPANTLALPWIPGDK